MDSEKYLITLYKNNNSQTIAQMHYVYVRPHAHTHAHTQAHILKSLRQLFVFWFNITDKKPTTDILQKLLLF